MSETSSVNPNLAIETEDDPLSIAIWEALNRVKDPCHQLMGSDLSIVDLGLVNRVDLVGDCLEIGITFTDASCTFAYRIINALEDLAPSLPGICSVKVVAETFPQWTEARLGPKARALHAEKATSFGLKHRSLRTEARSQGPTESRLNYRASGDWMRSTSNEQ